MSRTSELTLVRAASVVVFLVAAWSVWQRRLTLQSRFDAGTTAAIAAFGLGAILDAPWPMCATASHPVIGRYYGLMVLAHMCYVFGAAASNASVFARLLPDRAYGSFMRTRILPVVIVAWLGLWACFLASSVPLTRSVEHLYLAVPDGPLSLYWFVDFGSAVVLGGFVTYGLFLLRDDPRSVMSNLMLASAFLATLSGGLAVAWGILSGRIVVLRMFAWVAVYLAFLGYAIAAAVQWRHRVQQMYRPDAGWTNSEGFS